MQLKSVGMCFALALILLAGRIDAVRAVSLGETCGGVAGIRCDTGLWCDFPAGKCGVADATGRCARIPEVCAQIYEPVCGCNGRTFANDCERSATKVHKAHDGPCP